MNIADRIEQLQAKMAWYEAEYTKEECDEIASYIEADRELEALYEELYAPKETWYEIEYADY